MIKTILSAFIVLNFVISVQLLGESEFFPFAIEEYSAELEKESKELENFAGSNEIDYGIVANFIKQGGKKAYEVKKAIALKEEYESLPPVSPGFPSKAYIYLDQAEEILKPLADKGVSYAQLWLGYLYEEDKKNYELAEKYYKLGADRGYFDHNKALGRFYKRQKKYDLAEKHLLFVVNNPIFYNGKIKKEDTDRYSNLYYSSLELGRLYSIQKKYDLARKYYKIACEGGIGDAFDESYELEKQIKKEKK